MYPCDEVRRPCSTMTQSLPSPCPHIPCDQQKLTVVFAQPEKERMDIYHTMFLVARRQELHRAPLVESADGSTRILDVGTGTGIWAIDMAESVRVKNGLPLRT